MLTLALCTAAIYSTLTYWLATRLHHSAHATRWPLLLAVLPAALHALLLHKLIDTPLGQNLGLLNMAGMVSWIMVLLALIPSTVVMAPLALFAWPVAAVFSVLAVIFPAAHVMQLQGQWPSLLHIFSALLAYSLLLVAAAQALLLLFAEKRLRSSPAHLSSFIPPLTLQETFLFRVIATGFGLLTLSLLVAAFALSDLLATQPLHKPVFSLLSWITFAVLLVGRIRQGWRGRQAIRFTLIGFGFLLLAYVGTRLVLEFILNRA